MAKATLNVTLERLAKERVSREADACQKSFKAFIEAAWPIVEPGAAFLGGYHIDAIAEHLQACAEGKIKRLLINVAPRHGKLLADDTPMLTANRGWTTHGELCVGDFVWGLDGHPTEVLAVSGAGRADYLVQFGNGACLQTHANHEWIIDARCHKKTIVRDTRWLANRKLGPSRMGSCLYRTPPSPILYWPERSLPLDPYLFGVWLGDGAAARASFCFAERDRCILRAVVARAWIPSYETRHKTTGVIYAGFRGLLPILKQMSVWDNKHIPEQYLRGGVSQRLDLLAGLIDTDGYVDPVSGRVVISTCSDQLRDGLQDLIRGLGMNPYVSTAPPHLSSSGIQGRRPVHQVGFQPTIEIPTVVPRKKIHRLIRARQYGFTAVQQTTPKIGRCIQVAAQDGGYLAGEQLIPTHNSTLVSVLFPAWMWTHTPTERMLYGSYALDLARRDSTRTRRIVLTDWYRERWPHVVLSEDMATKSNFENTMTGVRQITSVGGPTTGLGGTTLVLDDPLNAKDAESAIVRQNTIDWVRESFSTRLNPGRQIQICIMQRLHTNDPSGYFIADGGWDELILPVEYEGPRKATSIGWVDPRKTPGEVLWRERFDSPSGREELIQLKRTLGAIAVAGQLQQRPVPRGGSTFKATWLRYWYDPDLCGGVPDPVCVPKPDGSYHECEQKHKPLWDPTSTLGSWDLSFKGGTQNDYVVGQMWTRGGKEDRANCYLLDQMRGQYDFVATVSAVRRLTERHSPSYSLVEEKANGAAIIAALKGEVAGLIAVNPQGGKESRASAVAPLFEAGNVWLPHPKMVGYEWVEGFVNELLLFPRGDHDDQVDATTQALTRLRQKSVDDIDMAPTLQLHAIGGGNRFRV